MDPTLKEAIEIELQPYNINSEGGIVSVNHGSLLLAPQKLSGRDIGPVVSSIPTLSLTCLL
jgi:hypothetical protein